MTKTKSEPTTDEPKKTDSDSDPLAPRCFNPKCEETFESVNDMVAVPGRGNRSPRHFCESCSERIHRGPPMTDGGHTEIRKKYPLQP